MPSRPACAAILLFWVYAAGALFRRDILPDLWIQPPPDLRTVAAAEDDKGKTTKWELSIADDSGDKGYRSVGSATTSSERGPDGITALHSDVNFDSGKLLRGTPFAPQGGGFGPPGQDHIVVTNVCKIDLSGNLASFHAEVRQAGVGEAPLLTLEGKVVGKSLKIETTGPSPLLNWTRSFPYESRGLIQNAVGPMDRLPGLQVGQKWETRVVSPLTGRVEAVKTEVTGRHMIQWDGKLIPTLMVVQHLAPISARTWVGLDGLVLKQEIPFPFVKLVLERSPHPVGRVNGETKVP